jgi:phosphate transport system substrate-binding protein
MALVLTLVLAACGGDDPATPETGGSEEALSGNIEIDGSSTVGPLTEAINEEYSVPQPDVVVNLGTSGTGGGFERFCKGETDVSNASRPIKDEEAALCETAGIEFTEVRVGTDALTMVVNPETDYVTCLTTEQLITLWGPDGATTWDQLNPDFPADPIEIFAPGVDSGTYDFFNETLEIEEPRQDFQASEDDNVIVQGIQGTPGAWGYFGFAFFQENADTLTAVEYDAGEGCVAPSIETAQDGSYGFTRPLFIYLKNESLSRPEVADYATFYVQTVQDVIESVGYIPEPEEDLAAAQTAVEEAVAAAK